MLVEQGLDYMTVLALVPVIAITVKQVKAIFTRDNHMCQFSYPHDCHGKLTVHHINKKTDTPENLATVCHEAHWEYLHNGASPEKKFEWQQSLSTTVREHTENAMSKGWFFPSE